MEAFIKTVNATNVVASNLSLSTNSSTLAVNTATTLLSVVATAGPHFARQVMRSNLTVVDKVPPEMLHMIDPHWYKFPPLDPLWNYVIGVYMTIIGVLGWFGNGIVVYIFLSTPALRSPSNFLVVNLAFSDFVMMVSNSTPMILNAYYETWVLGPLMCELYAMIGGLCGGASIWTMVFIALDRYNVIVKGMAGKPLTIGKVLGEIVLIWTFAAVWATFPMIGWNRYIPEGNMTACGTDYLSKDWTSRSYILVYSFFVYYTPLFMIIYSYWFIVATVAAHEKGMREQAKKMNVESLRSGQQSDTSAEAKLAKVAITTISLWFMAWTPYLVINYLGIFEGMEITPLFTIWGAVFAKTNACYNPIVYAISHPKFRAALDQKFPCLVPGKVEQEQPKAAASGAGDNASTKTGDGKA